MSRHDRIRVYTKRPERPKQIISRIVHNQHQPNFVPVKDEGKNVPLQTDPSKVPSNVMAYTDVLERSRLEFQYNTITLMGIYSTRIQYHGRIDGWIENALDPNTGSLQDDSATKIAMLYESNKIPVMVNDIYLGNIVRICATDIMINGAKEVAYEFQIVYSESVIHNALVKGLHWTSVRCEKISGTVVGIANRLILKLEAPFTIEEGSRQ